MNRNNGEPALWITLHSTKLDVQVAKRFSSVKWHRCSCIFPLAFYISKHGFALIALTGNSASTSNFGNLMLLSRDVRDECLHPFPDKSPGNIIFGHAVPPRLVNTNVLYVPDENEGVVYAAEYMLPQSTKRNLDNLNPDFSEHISGLKVGFTTKKPQARFSQFAWGSGMNCMIYFCICSFLLSSIAEMFSIIAFGLDSVFFVLDMVTKERQEPSSK